MSLKFISKEAIPGWIATLSTDFRLIAPIANQEHYIFADVHEASEIELGYSTSVLPPKKAFLPQREDLIRFSIAQSKVEPIIDQRSIVLFGVHTCDLYAIHLLDEVFKRDYADQHYLARRDNAVIVSLECLEPCSEQAFCKDMGTHTLPEEFDLHLTDIGEAYAVDIGSHKGAKLLDGINNLHEPTDQDLLILSKEMSSKWSRFSYRLEADISELPSLLTVSQKSVLWDELGVKCLGCGMCTIVCPTCYCFDVIDEIDLSLDTGLRYRVWDSCQLNQFATVAGGHDFRPTRAARQRHRFLRKYKYQSAAPGILGCVGCGRCASSCLVNISPVDVLNKLYHRRVSSKRNRQEALV